MASAMKPRDRQRFPRRSLSTMNAKSANAQRSTAASARGVQARRGQPSPRTVQPAKASSTAKASSSVASNSVVQELPRPQAAPPWLKLLLRLQQSSSILTLLLIVALLTVYGWTVYTQQRWGQAYHRLETLQKRERQLTAANEVLKNQIAKQAEAPGVGLVLPAPENTIFLAPAPQRPPVDPEVNLPPPQPIPARPLGY